MYEYIAITEKGQRRKNNEDRILINDHLLSDGLIQEYTNESIVAVICDGVGGEKGGELAAEISARGFQGIEAPNVSPRLVFRTINSINREISQDQHNSYSSVMATTIAGIALIKNRFILFNAGDTRIYEISGSVILKHSKDHIQKSGNHFRLINYLGGGCNMCSPYVKKGELLSIDSYIVICSDGVYKQIMDIEMHKILISDASLREKAKAILELAEHKGSLDDKSLIILHRQDNCMSVSQIS